MTDPRQEAASPEEDAAIGDRELLAWRTRVDDFMADTQIQRRVTAAQMGALENSVLELQGDVKESNEWSKKNHEALTNMLAFFDGMDNLRKLADTAMKWGKPFVVLAGFAAAVMVYWKTGKWEWPAP